MKGNYQVFIIKNLARFSNLNTRQSNLRANQGSWIVEEGTPGVINTSLFCYHVLHSFTFKVSSFICWKLDADGN